MKIVDLEMLTEGLSFGDAIKVRKALDAALVAMAHFGSDADEFSTIAMLHAAAVKGVAEAYKRHEREAREERAPGD